MEGDPGKHGALPVDADLLDFGELGQLAWLSDSASLPQISPSSFTTSTTIPLDRQAPHANSEFAMTSSAGQPDAQKTGPRRGNDSSSRRPSCQKQEKSRTGSKNDIDAARRKVGNGQHGQTSSGAKAKDPCAPKRPRNSFNLFLEDFKKINPNFKTLQEASTAAAKAWKDICPKIREAYDLKMVAATKLYHEAKRKYEETGGPLKFRYINGPHRPPGAFFLFKKDFMAGQIVGKKRQFSEMQKLGETCGQAWRELPEEKKVEYRKMADALTSEHQNLAGMTQSVRREYVEANPDPYDAVLAKFRKAKEKKKEEEEKEEACR